MSSTCTLVSEEIAIDILPSILNGPPFKSRTNSEKLEILKRGRPIPMLSIIKKDSSNGSYRTFQPSWYTIHKWLCASSSFNKLFCWPCVLMRPETSSWCSTGNDDMKMFNSLATKHAVSKSHLKAILEYDAMLTELGLPSEFINKKESADEELSNASEADTFILCFDSVQNQNDLSSSTSGRMEGLTEITNETYTDEKVPKIKTKITFKAMQTLSTDLHSGSRSKHSEDHKLLKWKRKMAKQELKNAELAAEKLQIEIEILKAKADYYKSVKLEEVIL